MEGFGDFYDFSSFSATSKSTTESNHYQVPQPQQQQQQHHQHQQFTNVHPDSSHSLLESGYATSTYNPFSVDQSHVTQEENQYHEIEDVKQYEVSAPPSSRFLAIYRGCVALRSPVFSDPEKRTIQMKAGAKTLQYDNSNCQYVVLAFEDEKLAAYEFVGRNELGKPIISIPYCNLDLVRNSKKDRAFFYFTSSRNDRDLALLADGGRNSETVCHVFHSFHHKTAALVCDRLQRHHAEERSKIRETILRNINFNSYASEALELNQKFKLGFNTTNTQDLNNNAHKSEHTNQKTENIQLLNFDDSTLSNDQAFNLNPFISSTPIPPSQADTSSQKAPSNDLQLIDDFFCANLSDALCAHLPPLPEQFQSRAATPASVDSTSNSHSSTTNFGPSIQLVRTYAPGMDPNFDVITGKPINYNNMPRRPVSTNPFAGLNFNTEKESVFQTNSSKPGAFGQQNPVERRSSFSKDFDNFLSQAIQSEFRR